MDLSARADADLLDLNRREGSPRDYGDWVPSGRDNYRDEYVRQIDHVSSEDVRAAARKYLRSSRLSVVAVGDSANLERALAGAGIATSRVALDAQGARSDNDAPVTC